MCEPLAAEAGQREVTPALSYPDLLTGYAAVTGAASARQRSSRGHHLKDPSDNPIALLVRE